MNTPLLHGSPWRLLATLALCILAGCSGKQNTGWPDDAASTSSAATVVYISGTVASGAPMIGNIEVKDGTGARKLVQISADGSYKLGLKGLTPPLLMRATGYVGGHMVVLLSAATTEDAGGTVNITPFTDLIVANVAAEAGELFFDAPDFSKLTASKLDEARVVVTQRLASVMTELAVDPTLDLRRSPFSANHTQFDAVLDVIRVSVNPLTNKATLSDVINGHQIEDDLGTFADADPLPAPPQGAYVKAVSELIAIDGVLGQLNALFANGVPAADDTALTALFDPDFLYQGLTLSQFLTSTQLLSPGNVGVKLINPVIVSRATDGSSMRVAFEVQDTLGNVIAYDRVDSDEMSFHKDTTGQWRIAGDRRMGDVSITAVNTLQYLGGQPLASRALELWVPSAHSSVRYVGFSGPGLPAAGVKLAKAGSSGAFTLLDLAAARLNTSSVPECPAATGTVPCIDFSLVQPNASYTVTFYDTAQNPIGEATSMTLAMPPASTAEVLAKTPRWFATFGTVSPTSFSALVTDTAVRINWVNPLDTSYTSAEIGLQTNTLHMTQTLNGKETSTVLGTWTDAAPTTAPTTWIWVAGPHDRAFATAMPYPQ